MGWGHSHTFLPLAQGREGHIFLDLSNSVSSDFNSSSGLANIERNVGKLLQPEVLVTMTQLCKAGFPQMQPPTLRDIISYSEETF